MAVPFNQKKHSDITITISGDAEEPRTFFLHKFPLVSKSLYFDEHIPDAAAAPGPTEIKITDFPGGPSAFEIVAKYCYGLDIELTVDNIAPVYCASRVLRVADLEKSTELFMTDIVLRDPVKSAIVLKVTAAIANMTETMMAGLVGHCINAIASMFAPFPELASLPPECFVVVVKTARDMEGNKRVLETAVSGYLKAHVTGEVGVKLDVDQFLSVVASPGRMDDMKHCEDVYRSLEAMLGFYTKVSCRPGCANEGGRSAHIAVPPPALLRARPHTSTPPAPLTLLTQDSDADSLCKGLHELGFWVCLPHAVIEDAYKNSLIPDRYCTVALMAENRHLLRVNAELAEQLDGLSDALKNKL
jgi:hypothetical protein